jgi:hypothetical protein
MVIVTVRPPEQTTKVQTQVQPDTTPNRVGCLMQAAPIDINPTESHHSTMRTTLTLDDDVFELVARQSKLRGVSLGKTVSDLLRRGLNASTPSQDKDGLVVFHLPADSPKVTTDDVRRIEAEGA